MNTHLKRMLSPACALAALLAFVPTAPAGAAAPAIDRIVVFGDSLSDPGNAFVLRHALSTPPYDTLDALGIPESPYARGGHHFSNGPTWVEQLGRSLAFGGDVRPAFRTGGPKAANYAVGGARAYDDGTNVNLAAQVDAFLADAGGVAPGDALYVIEFGGNDVRDALETAGAGGNPNAVLGASLQSVGAGVAALYAAGARRFLVWNAPDLRLAPAIRTLNALYPGTSQAAGLLAQGYNAGLAALLGSLSGLPDIRITVFDAFARVGEIAADPAAYGLRVVDAACVTPGVRPFQCREPDAYLFWDGIHPTSVVHGILANQVGSLIAQ
jgi:outer membrane lipase/esterase